MSGKKADGRNVATGMSNKDLIEAVNRSGYPLEKCVAEVVHKQKDQQQSSWSLAGSNYAVEFRGSRSEIDCILSEPIPEIKGDAEILAVIECKRAHPEYKTWMFLDEMESSDPKGRCVYCFDNEENSRREFRFAAYNFYPNNMPIDAPMMRKAVEVRDSRTDKKRYTTQQVQDACFQATIGAFALTEQRLLGDVELQTPCYILPVVITTAKLKKIFLEDAINISDGNIDYSKTEISNIGYAYLTYSIPYSWLQCGPGSRYVRNNQTSHRFRENEVRVLIVNSEYFVKFLNDSQNFVESG